MMTLLLASSPSVTVSLPLPVTIVLFLPPASEMPLRPEPALMKLLLPLAKIKSEPAPAVSVLPLFCVLFAMIVFLPSPTFIDEFTALSIETRSLPSPAVIVPFDM